MPLKQIEILGTRVSCATYESALQAIMELARRERPSAVCPSNTHILSEARHDPAFRQIIDKFDMVLPDGMPVVWALNLAGANLPDRVYGPYLMKYTVERAPRPWRHFFFGDTEECLAALREVVKALQPDIDIVGALSPPFRPLTEEDQVSFAETINKESPDFVWIALPGVRMERWIIQNQHRYKRGVFLAVGDAFTLLTGRRKFAPASMQRFGLTWLYRMSAEPRRLGPRYLKHNFLFLYYALMAKLRPRG